MQGEWIWLITPYYRYNLKEFLWNHGPRPKLRIKTAFPQPPDTQKLESSERTLQLRDIQTIARGILKGLDWLEASDIVHRNLKPENILLNNPNDVVISDFRHARMLEFRDSSPCDKRTPQV